MSKQNQLAAGQVDVGADEKPIAVRGTAPTTTTAGRSDLIGDPNLVTQDKLTEAEDTIEANVIGKTKAQTGSVSDDEKVTGVLSRTDRAGNTQTSVSSLDAAEGKSIDVAELNKRKEEIGERVNPVANAASAANAAHAANAASYQRMNLKKNLPLL